MTTPQDPHQHLPGGRLDPAKDPDRYDPEPNRLYDEFAARRQPLQVDARRLVGAMF